MMINEWEQPEETTGLPSAPEGYRWNIKTADQLIYLGLQRRVDHPAKFLKKASVGWYTAYETFKDIGSFEISDLQRLAEITLIKKQEKEAFTDKKLTLLKLNKELHNAGDLR